jgi:hypothetical protein
VAPVSAPPPRAELPSWFWGVLGCLTVLGLGFTVMFFAIKSPSGTTAAIPPTVVAPTAPSAPLPVPALRPPGIQVEQLASPPAPPPVAPVRKAAPRPLKVARSPAPTPRAAPADESDDAPADETATDEEAPKRKAPARVRAAAPTEESADAP